MLVDSHCHLDRLKLGHYENGLSDALNAARESGVERFLCVCISEDNKHDVVTIAEEYDDVFASVGIHPCDISEHVLEASTLTQWAKHEKVVAIGETGLDYYHSEDHKDAQQESFARHLRVAGEQGLPTIVHTRGARRDTLDLIEKHGCQKAAGVLHCFTESWEMAEAAISMGYYVSISGIATFKNATELRDVVAKIPLDRLLIETDSPYLAPVPHRGKSNEPKFVKDVAIYLANYLEMPYSELCKITGDNFFRLFNRVS